MTAKLIPMSAEGLFLPACWFLTGSFTPPGRGHPILSNKEDRPGRQVLARATPVLSPFMRPF